MKLEEETGKEFEILKVNRYEVEENAVFLDYEVESLLKEISEYTETKFPMRLSLAKNLKTIKDVLNNHSNEFGQLLTKIVNQP